VIGADRIVPLHQEQLRSLAEQSIAEGDLAHNLAHGITPRSIVKEVRDLIDGGLIRLKPTAQHVMQHCEYGFTVNIPLEIALADNFLLATHFEGEPITPDHGYPVRGIVGNIPGAELKTPYFWKGGKWVRGIELMAQDRLGFWEQAGYHNEADIWKEQRVVRGW